jgi:hypothetical protein
VKQPLVALSALAALAVLAGCSSSHKGAGPSAAKTINTFSPAPARSSAAPNPVDVLRKTGVSTTASAAIGDGKKVANSVYFANAKDRAAGTGERISVVTYPSNAAREASGDVPNASDDAHWYITFDRGLVTVTGVEDAASHSVVFALPAQTIADRIGGHLIPRG